MKQCSKCKTKKEVSAFPHHSVNGKKYINSWCRDCCRLVQREKYRNNREAELERKKNWQKKNPEKVKESRRKTQWKIKNETIKHYGGKCACCGESEIKFLCIDHINDDGYKHRKDGRNAGGTASFYWWIKKNNYPTNLQVLCYNCNMAKSLYKICPHKQ